MVKCYDPNCGYADELVALRRQLAPVAMDFRKYDDPQTHAHCYEVRNDQGEVVLQLCQLTRGYSKPQPLPGFEVWPYVDDADQLGEVTFQADEGEEPWFFEPTDRSRRFLEMGGLWSRTLGGALQAAFAEAERQQAEERQKKEAEEAYGDVLQA